MVVVWARHLELIPTEVGCSIPKPVEPFIEAEPPLFLCTSEIIHSKCDLLHFRAFIQIVEVHDFTPPNDSSDDEGRPPSSDSSGDEYPAMTPSGVIFTPGQESQDL
jgi:hypothetical protein